ncbi:flagellar biosynthetic protein FliO [Diaminobutyricibacter tongyongensis]|uniref:Flagellar biosynthetic protein FliO n=1 Tax=Leifsonia tongyongensis TaxID=1268043 RepID=A0A6L9XVB4_9MICO|nr:flagellar biosynthetic protein FliO [Diaminobutyricibacter tongyongensis]NEN05195.1 flagellar biosynthetic protein FliO [Diaminobutyricibacter tongyongensis]
MDAVLTMLRVVVSLAAVLGVIWYLHRRVSRRQLGTKKKSNPVTVVGKQGIAAKASVVVVDVDGRRLVLGVTEHSVNVLHSAEPAPVAEASFAAVLEQADADADRDADPNGIADAFVPVSGEGLAPAPAASPVAGSILAASTWKLALTSVRNGLK